MEQQNKNKIIKYVLIGSTVLNMGMCLNLYSRLGRLEYKVYQMESDVVSSIQSLSHYIWEIKNNTQQTQTGQFQ